MNLKLRFALLFTFFVAVILLISSVTIYFLYYNYRESDFYERVKNEGVQFYNTTSQNANRSDIASKILTSILHNSTVYDERVVILDGNGKIVNKIPDTLHFTADQALLDKIKLQKEYYWYDDNNYQYVGLAVMNTGYAVIAAGFDKPGFQKLSNLKLILVFVFVGGLILTAFMSFFFVRQAFMPLTKLSMQMKKTTFQNLTQRIEVTDTKDEINDIARNFNGMLERLDGAFDFQRSFVYHASHELRTPLATMLSQTESALGKKMTEEEYQKLLISLKEEQQEMIELTNSLLLISQYDNMGYIQNWPDLRIDEVIYDTVGQAKRMLPNLTLNVMFSTIPENDNDFIIEGNDTLLKLAFINLIKNAYLYSIDQKVNITLESDGEVIFVHVDNTGTQLPNDEKDRIMTPFFRGGNALKTKGYGLGLSIVNRFISVHKGTVTYTPIGNDINRFTVTLNNANATKST